METDDMTNLPATVQLSTLSREIGALTDQLRPAEADAISKYLLSMRKAGMSVPTGMKPEDLESVYGYALSDVPAFGLKRAVEKIIKGEYPIKNGFIPLPPELAAMARAEAKTVRDDLTRLREKEATIRDLQNKPEPASEDARARVRSMLGRFRSEHEASKAQARGVVHQEPMTEDRAAYWGKIKDMKDADEVSAEQQAFRRKVDTDLSTVERREAAE